MSKLEELIAALEKSEGPSRALDRDIQCTVGGWHRITPSQGGGKHGAFISPDEWNGRDSGGRPILDSLHGTTMHRDVPPVTASIDAAVALVNRVLPGWHWHVGGCPKEFLTDADKPFSAELMGPVTYGVVDPEVGEEPIYDTAHAWAATPVLALCIAALWAKLAQDEA